MDKKLTELVDSNQATNILAAAIVALPGGQEALDTAMAEAAQADAAAQHQVGSTMLAEAGDWVEVTDETV